MMLFVDVLISWYICMCIYIYMYVCICIYIYVYIYMYIYICIYILIVMSMHMYIYEMSQPYMLNIPLGWDMSYLSIHLSIYIYICTYIDGEINIDGIEWGYILKQYWWGYIFHQYNWSWRICCWWISHWWWKTSSQGCSQAPRCHECLEISWDFIRSKRRLLETTGKQWWNMLDTLW